MDPPPSDAGESMVVADVLTKISEGRPLADARPGLHEDTRFFVLGLAPNAARISVRFWHEDSIGTIARRVAEHWQDLRIEPWPWRAAPALWSLLLETAPQNKADNIPPLLGGAMMRSVLTGARYPESLLAAVIARMRADGDVNGRRAAICKACLARAHRMNHEEEDIPVSLDPDNTNPAYRLGRLFALYENLQRAALGGQNQRHDQGPLLRGRDGDACFDIPADRTQLRKPPRDPAQGKGRVGPLVRRRDRRCPRWDGQRLPAEPSARGTGALRDWLPPPASP